MERTYELEIKKTIGETDVEEKMTGLTRPEAIKTGEVLKRYDWEVKVSVISTREIEL